jgi:hypothetical protein
VYDEKEVGIAVGELEKLILHGEAILAIKLESSSGLIYWTGKEYKMVSAGRLNSPNAMFRGGITICGGTKTLVLSRT